MNPASSVWKLFVDNELFPKRPQVASLSVVTGETLCPSCKERSLRFYYHELIKGGRIGTTYFWCPCCKKCGHSTGACQSKMFSYDDPFEGLPVDQLGELEKNNWFDRLDKLWADGVLPQKFKPKPKSPT